jgi:hypothetical protein
MKKVVNVIYGKNRQQLSCDVLIMLRILDELPRNITYKKSIQMCHACRFSKRWHIPQNCDEIVCVSEASKKSFGEEAKEAAEDTAEEVVEKAEDVAEEAAEKAEDVAEEVKDAVEDN